MKVILLGLLFSSQAFATTCILEASGVRISTGFRNLETRFSCNGNAMSRVEKHRGTQMLEILSKEIESISMDNNVALISCRQSLLGNRTLETCFLQ